MAKVEHSKSGNVTWYIDEEKKTIIAKIAVHPFELLHSVDRRIIKLRNDNGYCFGTIADIIPKKLYDRMRLKTAYMGKAVCSTQDTFDVEIGKRIALIRAKRKLRFACADRLWSLRVFISRLCNDIVSQWGAAKESAIKETEKYLSIMEGLRNEAE